MVAHEEWIILGWFDNWELPGAQSGRPIGNNASTLEPDVLHVLYYKRKIDCIEIYILSDYVWEGIYHLFLLILDEFYRPSLRGKSSGSG
jgi:hypothetical protein